MKYLVIVAICLLQAVNLAAQDAGVGEYSVVTGVRNTSVEGVSNVKGLVKRLYLKQENKWPNGKVAAPLLPEMNSDIYAAFILQGLAMSSSKYDYYWVKQMQKTGKTPPRSLAADTALRQLARNPYAVVVVPSLSIQNKTSVRVLYQF